MSSKNPRATRRLAGWLRFAQETNGRLLPRLPAGADGPLRALALDSHSRGDKAIIDAFAEFKLDHREPYDWRILMTYFADAHFGRKHPGRHSGWTFERLVQLDWDYQQIKHDAQGISDTEACKRLVRDKGARFSGRYKGLKASTLRRRLPQAHKDAAPYYEARVRAALGGNLGAIFLRTK